MLGSNLQSSNRSEPPSPLVSRNPGLSTCHQVIENAQHKRNSTLYPLPSLPLEPSGKPEDRLARGCVAAPSQASVLHLNSSVCNHRDTFLLLLSTRMGCQTRQGDGRRNRFIAGKSLWRRSASVPFTTGKLQKHGTPELPPGCLLPSQGLTLQG